ncbi:DUF402 domain-containing protein [Bacillus horti]|uniref:RNA-binding protein associated with RNAse of E/G family n=1 Tax=Caldalkalibacillus horti TaxID=77523 RepID=A0ABT9W5L3_9BACI|nr:DUF402 domain-containing protein [Bacillus horti]MDQ0168362.1 putative RNA-binding protein associated with RNAse of E/G family [Bacillus horti]
MLKRKQADRPNWNWIVEKRYVQEYVQNEHFDGDIGYIIMDKVKEPLNVGYDGIELCLADSGYTWIMFFPKGEFYSLALMLNDRYEMIQGYFDIIKSLEYSPEGIPIITDLYLDVVYLPNGQVYLLDEDELEVALNTEVITEEEYSLAKREASKLFQSLSTQSLPLMNEIELYIKRLKKLRKNL